MDAIRASDIQAEGGFEVWHRRATAEASRMGLKSATRDGVAVLGGQSITARGRLSGVGVLGRTRRLSEHDEQALVIARADALSATVPVLRLLHAIPNGGARSKATAGKLKAEGVRPGVPDLMLPVACHGYHGLYIEMKAGGGRTSDEQKRWHKDLRQNGYQVEVCVGADAAWSVLCGYLGIRG